MWQMTEMADKIEVRYEQLVQDAQHCRMLDRQMVNALIGALTRLSQVVRCSLVSLNRWASSRRQAPSLRA